MLGILLAGVVLHLKIPSQCPLILVGVIAVVPLRDQPLSRYRHLELRNTGADEAAITREISVQSLFRMQDAVIVHYRRTLMQPQAKRINQSEHHDIYRKGKDGQIEEGGPAGHQV
ncbi:hypothetical protein DSECCO2_578560 [anaerobic digester metagenome]